MRPTSIASTRLAPLALVALLASTACSSSDAQAPPAEAVDAGASDGAADAAPARGTVEVFATLADSTEGLAFAGSPPRLYVGSGGAVLRLDSKGAAEKVADVPAPVGLAGRASGALVVCGLSEVEAGPGHAVLYEVDPVQATSRVLVGVADGPFKLTNYVAVAPDGALVWSDSGADKLYRANADGSGVALVTDAIRYPNGLAFSADGATLFVASWSTSKLYSLSRAADGSYGAPSVYFDGVSLVDGVVALASGTLVLVTTDAGLILLHPDKSRETLAPASAFNVPANGAFAPAGYGSGWLYVTQLLEPTIKRVWVGEAGVSLPGAAL